MSKFGNGLIIFLAVMLVIAVAFIIVYELYLKPQPDLNAGPGDPVDQVLEFEEFGNGYAVTGLKTPDNVELVNLMKQVEIPADYQNKPVVAIADGAFLGEVAIERVSIPSSVKTVGANAFKGCTALTQVVIPSTIGEVGQDAFDGCTSLMFYTHNGANYLGDFLNPYAVFIENVSGAEAVVLHTNTRIIANNAFEGSELREITFNQSLEVIGKSAFKSCASLEKVNIPATVSEIPTCAFQYCTALTEVVFNDGIEKIGTDAFAGCSKLENVSVPSVADWLVTKFDSISANPLNSASRSVATKLNVLDHNPDGTPKMDADGRPVYKTVTEVTVDRATNAYAFYGYKLLEKVEITAGAGTLGSAVFMNCEALSTLELPAELTFTASEFAGCNAIKNVTAPISLLKYINLAPVEKLVTTGGDKITFAIFDQLESIVDLTFAASIKEVEEKNGEHAFRSCLNTLRKITLPYTTLEIIPHDLQAVITDVVLLNPKGDTGNTLEVSVFENYGKLETLVISDNYDEIADRAFEDFAALCAVSFPESLTTIGANAFTNTALESLVIAENVTSIGDGAFANCSDLTNLTLWDIGSSKIGAGAFSGTDNVKYAKMPTYLAINRSNLISIETTGGNSIASVEFEGVTSLTTVKLHDGITTIGANAFNGCSNLVSFTYHDSVTYVGDGAFVGCNKLMAGEEPRYLADADGKKLILLRGKNEETFAVDADTRFIMDGAFINCDALVNLTLPTGLKSIAPQAFSGCTALVAADIPGTVVSIGAQAFMNCSSLAALTLPGNSTTVIGDEAFKSCIALDGNFAITANSLGEGAFYGCTGIDGLVLNVNTIGNNAFENCTSVISVTINEGKIGSSAFKGCIALEVLTINSGVTEIGANAFKDITALSGTLNIPSTVTTIGASAFSGCALITKVTLGTDVTALGANAFKDCTALKEVYVPAINAGNIGATPFAGCTAIETMTVPVNACGIVPTDALKALTLIVGKDASGCDVKDVAGGIFKDIATLESVTLAEGITVIGEDAFSGCTALKAISIPNSLVAIGDRAFANCHVDAYTKDGNFCYLGNAGNGYLVLVKGDDVTSFTLNADTKFIMDGAFANCTALTELNLHEDLVSVGTGAFDGCTSIATATLPAHVIYAVPQVSLVTVTVNRGSIPEYAFMYAPALKYVTIGTSVTAIEDDAFFYCAALETLTFEGEFIFNGTPGSIGSHAFAACHALTKVVMEQAVVTALNIDTFFGCESLITVVIGANEYTYSETEPQTSNTHWHFDADGDIEIWELQPQA